MQNLNKAVTDDVEHLRKWAAGSKVSLEAVQLFGENNAFIEMDIDDVIYSRIYGKSYKADCSIPLHDLSYLKLLHFDINHNICIGELICNKSIAKELIEIFQELYNAGYPIQKMVLIDEYNADDEVSMQDNNSSAFNYRPIVGGGKLSKHAIGLAIDINPLYNPYVKITEGELYIAPDNAKQYVDRNQEFPYKICKDDLCYRLFTKYGFEWGGDWVTRKDYQHFEK